MKLFLVAIILLCISNSIYSQKLTVTVDSYSGDSTLSTGFDTLSMSRAKDRNSADRVVGVKNVHKGESKYWLFFYFSTSDITQNSVKISKKNFAYFVLNNNEYLRFSYSGREGNYSAKDDAGFFIDITNSIGRLRTANIKLIRFETSTLYHEIRLSPDNQMKIADIVNRLIR